MHLPMHKKIDLAGKIDMVVVFQAIEIDRLSNEIECLRITLKDSEWELRNYENY